MNKNIKIVFIFALFVGLYGEMSAQKTLKIGYFNSADLIKKMPEGDSAQAQIERHVAELQSELESMQKEYQRLSADYEAKEAELSDLLKTNKQKEIRSVIERIQTFQQSAEAEIAKKREAVMDTIYAKIKTVVADIAKEHKYDYILENHGIIWYANDGDDIFPLLLKKMNLK